MKKLEKILYVEDEIDIQKIVRLALVDVGGLDLHICNSGHQALALLETYCPDLILLDAMMPDMDGPATLQEIRKLPTGRKMPVVFITAKAQASEVRRYRELGALDVLTKPFDPMVLAQKIQTIWSIYMA